jgi:hypothetical protein
MSAMPRRFLDHVYCSPTPTGTSTRKSKSHPPVSLKNVVVVEALIAATGWRSTGLGFRGSTSKFPLIYQQIESAGRGVEHDLIAVTDEADGTTDCGLRGDVQRSGAPFGPAHTPVGHTYQIRDVRFAKYRRNRDPIGLRHAGRPDGSSIAQHNDAVRRRPKVGVLGSRLSGVVIEDDRRTAVGPQSTRCSRTLEDGASGCKGAA